MAMQNRCGGWEFGLGGENGVGRDAYAVVGRWGRHCVVWGLGGDKWNSAVWVYPLFLQYPHTRHTPPTQPTPTPNPNPSPNPTHLPNSS